MMLSYLLLKKWKCGMVLFLQNPPSVLHSAFPSLRVLSCLSFSSVRVLLYMWCVLISSQHISVYFYPMVDVLVFVVVLFFLLYIYMRLKIINQRVFVNFQTDIVLSWSPVFVLELHLWEQNLTCESLEISIFCYCISPRIRAALQNSRVLPV